MNNSKKLESSKNDTSVNTDIPSKYKKTEKITVILQHLFERQVDFSDSDMEAYWSHFELSVLEQERIFSDEIHHDDVELLWDYVIVNFFRLKVLGEQENFLDKKFCEEKEGKRSFFQKTNIEENRGRTKGKGDKKKRLTNINKRQQDNHLIDLENKKLEYFWKIELEAVGRSISTTSSLHIDKTQVRKLDNADSNQKESIFIHRLSLLYRAIYSLLTQDTLFEQVLSSQSAEIISSGIFLDNKKIPAEKINKEELNKEKLKQEKLSERDQSEKIISTARSFVQNFMKHSVEIEREVEVQLHKKFFALCFFVSYAQLQDMWRSLIIGYQLNLAHENTELFIERFNLYTDSVSAILGKTLMLFSSAQQEKTLFEPKKATWYNRVFTQLYTCISQRNPSFLSFTPHEHLSIIDRAEIFWVESLRSRLKYTDDVEVDSNKGTLIAQNTNQQNTNQQNTNQKELIQKASRDLAEFSVKNYDIDDLEFPVTEMKTSFISIRMTLYESFRDYFQHMVSSEEKFLYQDSYGSLQNKDRYQKEDLQVQEKLNKEELNKEKLNKEELNNTINFTKLLERAKRKSFQLYNWNAWSKLEKFSINTFLQPQIFERKVTAEATTDISATKILPCHLLFTNEELEITLLVYQQRLLLQILGAVSELEVRVDRCKLSSFDVPPEYIGLGFLWYELPKNPPEQIKVLYKKQLQLDSSVQIETPQIYTRTKNNLYEHEFILHLLKIDEP